MNFLNDLVKEKPYNLKSHVKKKYFLPNLLKLLEHHKKKSKEFKKIINHFNYKYNKNTHIKDFPYIPVRIFKKFNLKSIFDNQVHRILHSSGTTGNQVSNISLDKKNSKDQIDILTKLTSHIIGNKRLPMLVIDKPISKSSNNKYSARMAGITGFSIFGKDMTFALNEKMKINFNNLNNFLSKYKNHEMIIFGFTSIIWSNFIKELIKRKIVLNLPKSIVIHGGGWKKLININVNNKIYKKFINKHLNSKKIINYYGMIEQTGSIFFECENGFFHTSNFNDIIVRNKDLEMCKFNEKGFIQLISLIPSSYPGNSILTEDLGQIFGEDDCKCGLYGKYFKVLGRIDNAELRGCSDLY